MSKKTGLIVGAVLGVVGILLILAGPAFHLIPSIPALFFGIAALIVGGLVKGLSKKLSKEERREEPPK